MPTEPILPLRPATPNGTLSHPVEAGRPGTPAATPSASAGSKNGPRVAPPRRRRPLSPLVADAKRLARLLCLGVRTVRTMDYGGKLPRPLKLGTRTVWVVHEIRDWLAAGAPDRAAWEAIKKSKRR